MRAGWIKLSAGDDGITELEARILRAAAAAAGKTNAVIGSHTIKGRVVMDQLDIIEAAGYDPSRFISIHTQLEPDRALHLAVARRGAWIEFDSIGNTDDDWNIDLIQRVLDAGFVDQLLLSHDRGWYDPAKPGGGEPKPYTHLSRGADPEAERLRHRRGDHRPAHPRQPVQRVCTLEPVALEAGEQEDRHDQDERDQHAPSCRRWRWPTLGLNLLSDAMPPVSQARAAGATHRGRAASSKHLSGNA